MLYEALAGRTPFAGPNLSAILRAAVRGDFPPLPPGVSAECRELVGQLLQPDPQRRISLEQLMAHPWFQGGLAPAWERPLSSLPSSEASEVASEAQQAAGEAGEGEAQGAAPPAAAGQPRSAPSSRPGSSGGSLSRLLSGVSLAALHSSLSLQLPGMHPAGEAALPPVAEEASQASLHAAAQPEASTAAGGPGSRALNRNRSLDARQASPTKPEGCGMVKSYSSKAFAVSARAGTPK